MWLIYSCQTPSKPLLPFEFKEVKTITIAIPDSLDNIGGNFKLVRDGSIRYLAGFSRETGTIDFYDLDRETHAFSIPLSHEELDYSTNYRCSHITADVVIGDFHVANLDSIYLLKFRDNIITLVNRKGEKLDQWQVFDLSRRKELYAMAFNYLHVDLPYVYGEILGGKDSEQFYDASVAKIRLGSDTAVWEESMIPYPPIYQERLFQQADLCSRIHLGDTVLTSFAVDHRIHRYHAGELDYVEGKSPDIDTFLVFDSTIRFDRAKLLAHHCELEMYSGIYHDSHRNLIYRTALLQTEPLHEDGSVKYITSKPWSLQIYDRQFNVRGSARFPGGHYNFAPLIPIEEGVLIPSNYYRSPKYDKRKLSFSLFEVKRKSS